MSSTRNGAVILKSFADLPQHLDLESLPPGPPDPDQPSSFADIEATPTNSDDHQETIPSFSPARSQVRPRTWPA